MTLQAEVARIVDLFQFPFMQRALIGGGIDRDDGRDVGELSNFAPASVF